MPTSTLSPTTLRPPTRTRRASRVLVVVADAAAAGAIPDWAARWCRRSRWELRPHPETGPGTAATAAALDARMLVLRPDPPPGPEHAVPTPRVVAAVRRLPEDAPVIADAAACATLQGGRLTIVHAVPRSFGERSVGLDTAVAHGQRLLDAAASRALAQEPDLVVDCALLRVRPYELVGGTLDADLLVVGGPRTQHRGGARAPGGGLVAHSALHHAPCPVLLTPR